MIYNYYSSGMNKGQSSIRQPQKEDLILNEHFTYEFFQNNRYSISQQGNYEALCNNGFIKMYSKLCRVYWHTQNQFSHETKDWKFHISVKHHDLKKAWNLVAALFLKMKCRAGIKTIYLKESEHSQQGREITLYLIKYDAKYKGSAFAGDFGLNIDIQHSEDYWFDLCQQIQSVLHSYGVESNGCAEGDYPLGKYISFRNEAFVRNALGQSIYPPNQVGWNPLKMGLPISLHRFKQIRADYSAQQTKQSKLRPFVLLGLALLTSGFWFRLKYMSK